MKVKKTVNKTEDPTSLKNHYNSFSVALPAVCNNPLSILMENPFGKYISLWKNMNMKMDLILEQLGNRKEKSDLIDTYEACEFLKISRSSIYKMTALKTIPFKKRPGSGKLVFSQNDLTRWINQPELSKINIADDYLHKNLKVSKEQYN